MEKFQGLYYAVISEEDRTVEVVEGDGQYDYATKIVAVPEKAICKSKTYKVMSIGVNAFRRFPGLTKVEIPDSVTKIDDTAFFDCKVLTSVVIPNSVISVGVAAFGCCYSLAEIKVAEGNQSYVSIDGCLYSKNVTILHCCPGAKTSIDIPNTVTSIGEDAFCGCKFLVGVDFPNSVTSIGREAFNSCENLTTIDIPNSVTSIGEDAFWYCNGLARVTLGCSVASIGKNAFCGCSGLEEVYCMMETPIESEEPIFADEALMNAVLYVPAGCKEKYEAVDPWRNFYTIKEFDAVGSNKAIVIDEPSVTVEDGTIKVKNIGGQTVSIYDVTGVLVLSVKADGDSIGIVLPCSGTYIVKVNDTATKITL